MSSAHESRLCTTRTHFTTFACIDNFDICRVLRAPSISIALHPALAISDFVLAYVLAVAQVTQRTHLLLSSDRWEVAGTEDRGRGGENGGGRDRPDRNNRGSSSSSSSAAAAGGAAAAGSAGESQSVQQENVACFCS
jgi:hypothetical protein